MQEPEVVPHRLDSFNSFIAPTAQQLGVNADQLAAKLVGRWRSGAPMESVPALPTGVDPSAADASVATAAVLGDDQVNAFDYEPGDADGSHVPRAAHIRKVNPRSENPPGKVESNRHRICAAAARTGQSSSRPSRRTGRAPSVTIVIAACCSCDTSPHWRGASCSYSRRGRTHATFHRRAGRGSDHQQGAGTAGVQPAAAGGSSHDGAVGVHHGRRVLVQPVDHGTGEVAS